MKKALVFFIVIAQFSSYSQELTNEKVFYYYKQQPSFINFTSDTNLIITSVGLEDDLVWDIEKAEVREHIETYSYGEAVMNADGTEMCTASLGKYDVENKINYTSALNFYAVKTNQTITKKFTDLDIQRVTYHPTDSNLMAIIGSDENFDYRSAIFNKSTFEIESIVFQGKGAVMPLWQQFSPDGKMLLIGYGNSSYYGGISVYDLSSKKEINRISLKDQPKEFVFLEDGRIIMRGNKTSIIYDKNWIQLSTHNHALASIHPSGEYGIYFNNEKEAFFYYFETKTEVKLDLPILKKQDFSNVSNFYGYAKFSPDGKKLAIKYYKWHSNQEQTTADFPSFMVYTIE